MRHKPVRTPRWRTALIAPAAALALSLAGCQHKELCLLPEEHLTDNTVSFTFDYEQAWHEAYPLTADSALSWLADWPEDLLGRSYDELRPDRPEGVRIRYRTPGGKTSFINLDPDGGRTRWSDEEYQLLLHNNDTEYILFEDDALLGTVTATTRTRTRATYLGNSLTNSGSETEKTVNPPDMLYSAYIESFRITPLAGAQQRLDVMLQPAVFSYIVRFSVEKNYKAVVLARGALAGMAREVNLIDRSTTAQTATLLFDAEVGEDCIVAVVRSFGIPSYTPGSKQTDSNGSGLSSKQSVANVPRYGLNLEVMLANGQMLSFDFDVTDQVSAQPNGGVVMVSGIEIPDEALVGGGGGGGFSASVSDWGPYQDVIMDITYN